MGFYSRLKEAGRNDDAALQTCILRVVDRLDTAKDPSRPGMLLGKIQSGKTRAFLGVIAQAFDRDYDIAIVLTKGTKTLAIQTVRRIAKDFRQCIKKDELTLFDIMAAPDPLTRAELRRKLIIVAKKQVHNLTRIQALFDEKYPELKNRRVLLIDDEADMASVRFTKKRGQDDFDQGVIANQMDVLRRSVERISFLQVTATPYALYLQPENYERGKQDKEVFYPKRPAFTELLPIHSDYVGGDAYFGGSGLDDPRAYLYAEVDDREHDALRSNDGRTIREDRIWSSDNIKMLRRGLISFLLSIAIRRYQQQACGDEEQKYAMIIHNDTQREAHNWQWETVNRLLTVFEEAANEDDPRLRAVFDEAYSDLRRSVTANGGLLPSADDGFARVKELITDGEMNVQRVNSDVQLEPLLDTETAELTLRTKAKVFIGGSILDRGITVPNLLAFYYGRNPKRVQADTALQHSRMYGARPIADLAVTRFYTSKAVYARLSQIHSLEEALRQAFEGGAHDRGVVFIQSDASKGIIPCSPDKVSLSDVVAVRPNAFLLPTDFNTLAAGRIRARVESVDGMIPKVCIDSRKYAEISIDRAIELIEQIEPTIELDETSTFEWSAMKSLLRYYAKETNGKVLVLAETNRGLSKEESGDKSGLSIIGGAEIRKLIREPRRVAPVLLLLKQRGGPALDWKAGPFWWPVLATPPNSKPCVFAGKSAA